MVLEDPAAYHLAYGRSPVPGRAMGVLRGRLGGDLSGPVRLAFHDTRVPESTRGAVLFPAAPGSPPTPPGGGFYAKTEQWCAVVDGIAWIWNRLSVPRGLHSMDLLQRAVVTAQETGIAAIGSPVAAS